MHGQLHSTRATAPSSPQGGRQVGHSRTNPSVSFVPVKCHKHCCRYITADGTSTTCLRARWLGWQPQHEWPASRQYASFSVDCSSQCERRAFQPRQGGWVLLDEFVCTCLPTNKCTVLVSCTPMLSQGSFCAHAGAICCQPPNSQPQEYTEEVQLVTVGTPA
jgi:hypothetical protein